MYENGQLWRDFRIVRQIDVGGMAEVLQVEDQRQQVYAAKILRGDRVSERFLRQFEYEVEIHPRVKHPNIVACHGVYNQPRGLLMAYIDGGTVRGWMKKETIYGDSNGIMQMFSQVTDALTYLHESERIVHCDLKPENILIDRSHGRFLLTDFGISHQLGQPLASQRGTPKYMAPEQYLGKPVDARTDVYSLGITIYEILTGGKPPFTTQDEGSSAARQRELKHLHINVRPPLPSSWRPEIRSEIDAVLLRALEKDPNNRYDTVKAFYNALHQAFSRPLSSQLSMSATTNHYQHMEQMRREMPAARLICTTGQIDKELPLEPVTLMGRKREDCNVPLRGGAISRRHAMIEWRATDGEFYVYDQGSLIGTRVNGKKITDGRSLNRGDLITIGAYNFRFE